MVGLCETWDFVGGGDPNQLLKKEGSCCMEIITRKY
jgi:hypothetical protein